MRISLLFISLWVLVGVTNPSLAQLGTIRPIDDVLSALSQQIAQIEGEETHVISKIKTDLVFKESILSGATEFEFTPERKYRILALLSEREKVQGLKITIYRSNSTTQMPMESRSWQEVKSNESSNDQVSIEFVRPKSEKAALYKVEVRPMFKPDYSYTRYGLIFSERDNCWEGVQGLSQSEKNESCSIRAFFSTAATVAKDAIQGKGIEVVGIETGFLVKSYSDVSSFSRKFYSHSNYHFYGFSDNNIKDAILGIGDYRDDEMKWIRAADNEKDGKADNEKGFDIEIISSFNVEADREHRVAFMGKEFAKDSNEGRFVLIIGRNDRPAKPFPAPNESQALAKVASKKYTFNQVQIYNWSNEKWTPSGRAVAKVGYLDFCPDLTSIQMQIDNSSVTSFTVYNRWQDKEGSYHFEAREKDKISGKGYKFYISKDASFVGMIDHDKSSETYYAFTIANQTQASNAKECNTSGDTPESGGTKISTYQRIEMYYNDDNKLKQIGEAKDEATLFEFNQKKTMFTHTTPTITSTYYIKKREYDAEKKQETLEIESDVGNTYSMMISQADKIIYFAYKKEGRIYVIIHKIKGTW
jgi:hypothetical protein